MKTDENQIWIIDRNFGGIKSEQPTQVQCEWE